jgi:hypothetical protein
MKACWKGKVSAHGLFMNNIFDEHLRLWPSKAGFVLGEFSKIIEVNIRQKHQTYKTWKRWTFCLNSGVVNGELPI